MIRMVTGCLWGKLVQTGSKLSGISCPRSGWGDGCTPELLLTSLLPSPSYLHSYLGRPQCLALRLLSHAPSHLVIPIAR